MKPTLLFSFVLSMCHANNLNIGNVVYTTSVEPSQTSTLVLVDAITDIIPQETIVDNPDFEPVETTTVVSTTTDGTVLYYCVPTQPVDPPTPQGIPNSSVYYSSVVDAADVTTLWYTTTALDVNNVPSSWATWTTQTAQAQETWAAATTIDVYGKVVYYCPEKTTTPVPTATPLAEPPTTSVHECIITKTVDVQSVSTCVYDVQTLKMDVYKTIYVSSCVVTDSGVKDM